MTETAGRSRPISPHLTIYRRQINSAMSIFHRLTGLGLAASGMLVVWWFLAAASSPAYFRVADAVLTSWIGNLVLLVSLAALWYHFFSGIRHLVWDTGAGLGVDQLRAGSIAVLAAAGVMTVLTVLIAL